jgi:hypothetical protein
MDHKDFHDLSAGKKKTFSDLLCQKQIHGKEKVVRRQHQENGHDQTTLPAHGST